jgi:hypothetical protein
MPISKIKSSAIDANAITGAGIADGTVDTADLANGAVTSAKLDTNISVTGDFTADSSNDTLFVDASTNRVHIGGGTSDTNTSALSVRKNGGGNFIANFENTSTTAPYGVMVRDPSGSAAGYPLLQVSNSGGNHYFRVDSNTGKNYFAPGGTEKVRIDSDGMKFNGDTAAANALDDYEEGTFTPTCSRDSSASAHTYAMQHGNYTKIGRMVNVKISIQITGTTTTGSGGIHITGLPFSNAISGAAGYGNTAVVHYNTALPGTADYKSAFMYYADARIHFELNATQQDTGELNAAWESGYISVSLTYFTS